MGIDAKGILFLVAEKEFNLSRDSMVDRLKLQKTIYLLEASGMQLGYGFGWYRYGPYSQDLVYDAYDVLQEEEDYGQRTKEYKFNAATNTKIGEFKRTFGRILGNSQMLELVASICFIKNTWYPELNESNAFKYLTKHKTLFYNGEEITEPKTQEAFVLLH